MSNSIWKQECEICGKKFDYKQLRLQHTIDGDILVCGQCLYKLQNQNQYNNITTKTFPYDETNAITDEETIVSNEL